MRPLALLLLLGFFSLPVIAVAGADLSGSDPMSRSDPPTVLLSTLEVHGYSVTIGGTVPAVPGAAITRVTWD